MDELSRCFDILEIRRGASIEEVKRAYRDMAQVWHPDRYAHNPRLRAKAEEKLKTLNEAYQRISTYTERTSTHTSGPAKNPQPPPTSNPSTGSSARTEPRETKPPPNTSPPPPKPPPTSTPTRPTSAGQTSNRTGCIVAAIVVLVIIILIVASQQDRATSEAVSPTRLQQQTQSLPNTSNDQGELSRLKAEIEDRVVRKDSEFERLNRWYQQGVTSQDEVTYRTALETAQQEEQAIAALILAYNEKKKKAAPSTPPPRPTFTEPELTPPVSGEMHQYTTKNGVAPLQIRSSSGSNYLVKLDDVTTGQPVLSVFVCGGQTEEINVPLGTYVVKYASGDRWFGYTHLFGPDTQYSKADQTFSFTFDGYQYSGYTVTLYKVQNGNLSTSKISPDDF